MLQAAAVEALRESFPQIVGDSDLLQKLTATARVGSLHPGHTICHEGQHCSQLALVTAGSARVFKLAESGREITLYRVEAGECCILTASCMLSNRPFPANATVESDLDALLLPEASVQRWMASSECWRHFLWNLLARRLGDVISLVEEVAFRRMDERLCEYLTAHASEPGRELKATHSQIAADLGTSREVVSRVLKDFESRGLLRLGRGHIHLIGNDDLRKDIGLCD